MQAITTIALLAASTLANAYPVEWEFQTTIFDDGGQISGSFVWDADESKATNVSIITTSGSTFSGTTYDTCQGGQCNSGSNEQTPRFIFSGAGSALFVKFDGPLSNAGGVVSIVTGVCSQSCENWRVGLSRNVISGQLSSVPAPPAIWLLGSALFGLGWLRNQ